ncbi:hypothetical protein ACHAPE_006395 [Trichoderma viride]
MAYTRRFLSRVSDPAHNPTARPQAPTLFPIDSIDEYLQLVKIFSSSLLLTFAMTFLVAITTVVGFGRFGKEAEALKARRSSDSGNAMPQVAS